MHLHRFGQSPRHAQLFCAAACFVLSGIVACGGDDDPGVLPTTTAPVGDGYVCVPGQVDSCACGASQGTAICSSDGKSWGMCACPPGDSPAPTTGVGSPMLMPGSTTGGGQTTGGGATTSSGEFPTSGGDVPTTTGTSGAPDAGTTGTTGTSEAPLAEGVRISEVALYQAVKVSLAQDGEAVIERNAPVVVGKEAFLRVFVEPMAGFSSRELEAHLTLTSGGETEMLTASASVSGGSSDGSLESTINFDIPTGTITEDTEWSVSLHDAGGGGGAGADPAARYPTEAGAQEKLGARNAGPLRVMIVPYRFTPDGSNRLPHYEEEQMDRLRSYIYSFFPIIDVEIEIHDPVDYDGNVTPNTGWERFLDDHCALRTRENSDPKVIYYGLLSPEPDARAYGGGVYGISYLPGPAANFGRCSVGVGFEGDTAASVMAHEIGHSLGLPHAPCGVSGGPYPYPEATIGAWGFGLSSRTLKDPGTFKDMMSYCNPVHISDYNFQKLFERIRYLNLQFDLFDPDPTPEAWARIFEDTDGTLEVVGHHALDRAPGGVEERRSVELFDADGASLGTRDGYFLPRATGSGGVWFVPEEGQAAVVLDAGKVAL